jgi:ATP-dependent RNA helicase DeaD
MDNTFEELGLCKEIQQAVTELGFENPTPIQAKAIPILLADNRDLVALAQTGTGKTAAFGLPLIEKTDSDSRHVQSLILCPTRELCLQIARDLDSYAKHLRLNVVAVYGGAPIEKQIRSLKNKAHIVVGTPGRMIDLINRRVLKLANIKYLVLDEADEMLTMGFKDDLDTILSETPREKQTMLFSATMPKAISSIAKKYMNSPQEISSGKRNEGAKNVTHYYCEVDNKHRYSALKRLADSSPNIYAIIFCRTRRETKDVADRFIKDGYNADALHGDLSQAQRDTVMGRFRNKNLQLLVATDVAARGLDVNDLTHVINYNLPDDVEVYTHRSGRTGRAGKTGESIVIITPREFNRIRAIERIINKKFEKKAIPTGKEICQKQLFKLIDKIENIEVNEESIEEFLPIINEKLESMTREDLLKRFVYVEFDRFLSYYKNAPDLNARGGREKGRDRDKDRDTNFARFFMNIGSKDSLNAGSLINFVNQNAEINNANIGKIEILQSYSFFEIDNKYAQEVLRSLKGASFDGITVDIEPSKPKRYGGGGDKNRRRSRRGGGNDFSSRRSSGGGGNSQNRSYSSRKKRR